MAAYSELERLSMTSRSAGSSWILTVHDLSTPPRGPFRSRRIASTCRTRRRNGPSASRRSLAEAIDRALTLEDSECPAIIRQEGSAQLTMLGQFLSSALSSICRQAEVAASLVGTPNDVRELVAYRLGQLDSQTQPVLTQGWRAKVVGRLIDDLLSGKVSIRIQNPRSEQPLAFEKFEG